MYLFAVLGVHLDMLYLNIAANLPVFTMMIMAVVVIDTMS